MGIDVLIFVLVLLIVAVFPAWPHSRNWGYTPSGGIGAIVVILMILLLLHMI